MKVLLTHGYFLDEDPKEQLIMKPYPPLGLLYISSFLEENDIAHEVFDTTFSSVSEWKSKVLNSKPDLIAFYVNLMTKVKVIQLMKWIAGSTELRETKVVLGGPDVTYNIDRYLNAGADFIISGEGEETMLELIEALRTNDDLGKVNGLAFKSADGIQENSPRVRMKNLDDLPLPNRSRFPVEKYLDTWKKHHGKSALNISTQRGCPYTCKWCSTAVYGQSYRRRSPEQVVAELKHLKERFNPDTFWFVDDVFTVSHKWMRGFADAIQSANLTIEYECITRAERMNDEIIDILASTGCFRVWIGAESGSQRILDAMDRRVDVEVVKSQLQAAKRAGIATGTFIMVGYPGETYSDIRQTARYLEEAQPTDLTITKCYPIKGTDLFDEIEEIITVEPDWETSTDRQIDFNRRYPNWYYSLAIRYIYNRMKISNENRNISNYIKALLSGAILRVSALIWR